MISDADRELRNALIGKALNHQICINHAVREVSYTLWKAGLPRHERKEVCRRLRSILSACRNSVIEHLKDKNIERLKVEDREGAHRTEAASQGTNGGRLDNSGKVHTELSSMITFARLAMKQILIPYTNNLIERLMGEIAKRVKNK